jgi:hypothetical protein
VIEDLKANGIVSLNGIAKAYRSEVFRPFEAAKSGGRPRFRAF